MLLGLTVVASDSEAIQTEPQQLTPSLDRFALLAMTGSAGIPGQVLSLGAIPKTGTLLFGRDDARPLARPVTADVLFERHLSIQEIADAYAHILRHVLLRDDRLGAVVERQFRRAKVEIAITQIEGRVRSQLDAYSAH